MTDQPTPALSTVADTETEIREVMEAAGFTTPPPTPTEMTQVLSDLSVPEPEPTPAPYVAPRYVTVWPHTLSDFERFDDAVASIQPNGVLLIHRFGDDPRWIPPVKGYAPGAWVTFEHVGDFTPPKPQPPTSHRGEPAPAPRRSGGIQTDPEFARQVEATRTPTDAEVRAANDQADRSPRTASQFAERFYGDRRTAAERSGGMAVRPHREYPVNLDEEGGGEQAPKASTGATTAPTEPPADPDFWGDDEPARKPSLWLRFWRSLTDGPRPDPSLPEK